MKDTWTPGLSRREFLAGASALGGVAIASTAAPAQITTMAPFEKLPPYGNHTLPAGVKPPLNMVRDQIALVSALGYRKAELIVGHDQGQLIATYAAIVRPDMFLRLTTVSSVADEVRCDVRATRAHLR